MTHEAGPRTRRELLAMVGVAGGGLALAQSVPAPARAAERLKGERALKIETPTEQSAAPYGALLGTPFPAGGGPLAFATPNGMQVWSQTKFDAGPGGEMDIVWVHHVGDNPLITNLEQHHLTEQAIIPLTGDIVHIVCLSGPDRKPDLATMKAFRLSPGIGLTMSRDVWHGSRSRGIINMMLSRKSTSLDTADHRGRQKPGPMVETSLADISPVRLVDPI